MLDEATERISDIGRKSAKHVEHLTIKNDAIKSIASQSSKMAKRVHHSDDPLYELGPGISTFHQLLVMLFALFSCLLLLHIPVMLNFQSYDFYDGVNRNPTIMAGLLGNMGFSQTRCETASMISGNYLDLECKSGSGEIA